MRIFCYRGYIFWDRDARRRDTFEAERCRHSAGEGVTALFVVVRILKKKRKTISILFIINSFFYRKYTVDQKRQLLNKIYFVFNTYNYCIGNL